MAKRRYISFSFGSEIEENVACDAPTAGRSKRHQAQAPGQHVALSGNTVELGETLDDQLTHTLKRHPALAISPT
jgi:hypothetical protein